MWTNTSPISLHMLSQCKPVIVGVVDGLLIGVLFMSSRSEIGRRVASGSVFCMLVNVGAEVHSVGDIDPDETTNMSFLLALDRTQAAPQSFCLNAFACINI